MLGVLSRTILCGVSQNVYHHEISVKCVYYTSRESDEVCTQLGFETLAASEVSVIHCFYPFGMPCIPPPTFSVPSSIPATNWNRELVLRGQLILVSRCRRTCVYSRELRSREELPSSAVVAVVVVVIAAAILLLLLLLPSRRKISIKLSSMIPKAKQSISVDKPCRCILWNADCRCSGR